MAINWGCFPLLGGTSNNLGTNPEVWECLPVPSFTEGFSGDLVVPSIPIPSGAVWKDGAVISFAVDCDAGTVQWPPQMDSPSPLEQPTIDRTVKSYPTKIRIK